MATSDEILEAIGDNATGPKRARIDDRGHETEQHSIGDQLKAVHHVASQVAKTKNNFFGCHTKTLVPPGCG